MGVSFVDRQGTRLIRGRIKAESIKHLVFLRLGPLVYHVVDERAIGNSLFHCLVVFFNDRLTVFVGGVGGTGVLATFLA